MNSIFSWVMDGVEQLNKGHCNRDLNCWIKTVGFQSVSDKLLKHLGHIGGSFLI